MLINQLHDAVSGNRTIILKVEALYNDIKVRLLELANDKRTEFIIDKSDDRFGELVTNHAIRNIICDKLKNDGVTMLSYKFTGVPSIKGVNSDTFTIKW